MCACTGASVLRSDGRLSLMSRSPCSISLSLPESVSDRLRLIRRQRQTNGINDAVANDDSGPESA